MRLTLLASTATLAALLSASSLPAQTAAERAILDTVAARLATSASATGRDSFDWSVQQLERILDRNSRLPEAWHLLGRTRLAMSERGFVVKQTPYHHAGLSYRRGAMQAYAGALKADSSYQPAADALSSLVVLLRARKLNQEFRPLLRVAGRQPGASPVIHLALSRLAWSAGRYEEALAEVQAYAADGDSTVAAIESARALAALERIDDAAKAYEARGTQSSDAASEALREDLSWVATPEELAQFDSLPGDSVSQWVTLFWRQRDVLEMRSDGERLREHLRRWTYAHQKFLILRPDDAPIHSEGSRNNDQWSVVQGNDPILAVVLSEVALGGQGWKLFERTQWEVDDRGAIYVRHGEPTKKVSSPSGPPNESWMYKRAASRPVFHFLGSHALGTTAATSLVALLPLSPEMLTARGDLDPRYQALGEYIQGRRDILNSYVGMNNVNPQNVNPQLMEALNLIGQGYSARSGKVLATLGRAGLTTGPGSAMPTLSTSIPQMAKENELRGRATIREAMVTDGFPQVFDRQLNAVVSIHGVGIGIGDQRRVLAVFALEGSGLVPQPRPDGKPGHFYPVAIRLVAMDRHGGIVRQLDTIRNFVTADSLGAGRHLTGFLELPLPAGIYQVRALFKQPGLEAAAAGARDGIDLLNTPSELALSDLILGREGSTLNYRLGDDLLPLNPLNAFAKGADAQLFYEISGLRPGLAYETVVAVRRPGDKPGSKPAIEVTTAFEPGEGYQRVHQGVGLAQLKPGPYWLEVTLREAGGTQQVIRKQFLNILDK